MQFWQQISLISFIFIAPSKLLFPFISKSLPIEPIRVCFASQNRKAEILRDKVARWRLWSQLSERVLVKHKVNTRTHPFFIRRKYPFSSVAESTPANVARRSTTLYSCVIRFTISKKGNATGHFDACHHHFFDVLFAWKIVRAWNLSYNNLVLMVVNSPVTLAFCGYIW